MEDPPDREVPEQSPLVSVCIAHYGDPTVLAACLESVNRQECSFSFEVLVHDDASLDDIGAVVAANPRVRWLRSDSNVGYCVANNRMARIARGRYLLLLNNDAELFADSLQTLKGESDAINEAAILTLPQFDARTGSLIDRGALLDPFLNSVPNRETGRRDVAMVAGSCLWIPRDVWDQLGGFPEWFGSLAEDLYLCCRARLSGVVVRVAGGSGYRHRVGHSLGGGIARDGRLETKWQRRRLSERNKTYVASIIWPSPWAPLALGLHVSLLLIEGALLAFICREVRYLTIIYLPIFRSLWRERSRLLLLRRDVQSSRKIGLIEFLRRFVAFPQKAVMLWRHGLPHLS